jgi:hypothetical protein
MAFQRADSERRLPEWAVRLVLFELFILAVLAFAASLYFLVIGFK